MFAQSWRRPALRYGTALGLVAAAFLGRLALEPVFGPGSHVFSLFYLTVVFAAYFCGTIPAAVAAILSGTAAYWAFAAPAFAWKIEGQALTSMGFFALTSAVDIYFITGMKGAMHRYRLERTRAEILAQGHAALFHEYNERAANHLHLLAAMLKSGAEGSGEAAVQDSRVIAEASRRTILLSSVHRSLSPQTVADTDFPAFARDLLESIVRAAGAAFIAVEVEGDPLVLPADRAASVAVVLFEWTRLALPGVVQARHPRFVITLESKPDDEDSQESGMKSLSLSAVGWNGDDSALTPGGLPSQIISAMTDHLGGRQSVSGEAGLLRFALRFPVSAPQTLPATSESMLWTQAPPTIQ